MLTGRKTLDTQHKSWI